jgi:histidinol-phosphatase (PHP family)
MPIPFPLDAHLHTNLSPDADVPIDAHAALAREQGVSELCITDHVDFDPGDPAYAFTSFELRERTVREAAERWADSPVIRFGAEITYERRLEDAIREHLARHRYDYVIGSVHPSLRNPMRSPADAAEWCAGKTHREASAWYWDEVESAVRSGLFDTIGHLDFVKRYMQAPLGPFEYEPHADIYDRLLTALIETGTALEVNSSGLRQEPAEAYPGPVVVERFRQLGGERVVAGSDAHRIESFGFGLREAYRSIAASGFRWLSFRRGDRRVVVDMSREIVARVTVDGEGEAVRYGPGADLGPG